MLDVGGGTNANGVATGDSTDDGVDAVWDTLAPGDTITWTATYTVTNADFINAVGGDGSHRQHRNRSGYGAWRRSRMPSPMTVIRYRYRSLPLLRRWRLPKIATPDSGYGVGDTITYDYVVTNTGNVPMTNVGLVDNVTAGSGIGSNSNACDPEQYQWQLL